MGIPSCLPEMLLTSAPHQSLPVVDAERGRAETREQLRKGILRTSQR